MISLITPYHARMPKNIGIKPLLMIMMFVAAQTQRIVFRHKRFGRRSIPSSTDITEGTDCILKPPEEQNTDIQSNIQPGYHVAI